MLTRVLAAASLAASLALAGCASADTKADAPRATKAAPTKKSEPAPKYDGKAYAAKVETTVTENLMRRSIRKACDYSAMTWHCFFEAYESPRAGWINVQLSLPGDVSSSERDELAKNARIHTFNMAGMSLTDLKTVVSYVDGIDRGTATRDEIPLLR